MDSLIFVDAVVISSDCMLRFLRLIKDDPIYHTCLCKCELSAWMPMDGADLFTAKILNFLVLLA